MSDLNLVEGNDSKQLTLQGGLAALNAALAGLVYRSDDRFSGAETLTLSVDDLGNTGAGGALSDSLTIAVEVTPAGILLEEKRDFSMIAEEVFTIPESPTVVRFTYTDFFDSSDPDSIKDAFEVALLDDEGNSLVHTFSEGQDAFFNLTEGLPTAQAAGVTLDGQTVALDLSDVPAGTEARLVFRLVNNDDDTATAIRIQEIELLPGEENGVLSAVPRTSQGGSRTDLKFNKLEEVPGWLQAEYGRTSFNGETQQLSIEVAVKNIASDEVRDQLVMVIENLSDATVRVLNADGLTPEGNAYFNLSNLLGDDALVGGETSDFREVIFSNPDGVKFDYELSFLSTLNVAPTFVSTPALEAIAGKAYRYDADANDSDGDELTYSLLGGPEGLSIDNQTGEIVWNPAATDIGSHQVRVQVEDSHGGFDEQTYTLTVSSEVPNRPPVIVTIPVVDAEVGVDYQYDVNAQDPDQDELQYQLVDAPDRMTIEADTGLIQWQPTEPGIREVVVEVTDSNGGKAAQRFEIKVGTQTGNTAPIIVSDPFTQFELAGESNSATGLVNTSGIDLDLGLGEALTDTVSLTLSSDSTAGLSFADIVFVVDESGSMGGEHDWIQDMVLDLNAALEAEGIGPNYFGLVGYTSSPRTYQVGDALLGTAEELSQTTNRLRTSGGTEDGYEGIEAGLNYPFREGSAVNIILVTDEDRDNTDISLTFNSVLGSLSEEDALLNAVVNASFSNDGQSLLGLDYAGNSYQADGSGDFIADEGGLYTRGSGSTKQDYIDLAWASGGAAWDLGKLRNGGLNATSFTEALVDIKVEEIKNQRKRHSY